MSARPRTWFERWIAHPLEYALAKGLLTLVRALPLDLSSAFGGWLARSVGPWLPVSRIADDNLRRALPELSAADRKRIIRGVWDNLGRTAAEFPHLDQIAAERVELIGGEHLTAMRDDGVCGFLISGHIGNWEVNNQTAARNGLPLVGVYRAANNPLIDALIRANRVCPGGRMIAKGSAGARELVRAAAQGEHLGLLVDQKMNDGVPVPFFGRMAMTAAATAQLAIKRRAPVHISYVRRLRGAHFQMVVDPVLPQDFDDAHHDAVLAMMTAVNARLEQIIREAPEQWLWLHRRWPKEPKPQPSTTRDAASTAPDGGRGAP